MNYKEAIDLMKTSKNIKEWNSNRELVKEAFNTVDLTRSKAGFIIANISTDSPLVEIDSTGLISKVIKPVILTESRSRIIVKRK